MHWAFSICWVGLQNIYKKEKYKSHHRAKKIKVKVIIPCVKSKFWCAISSESVLLRWKGREIRIKKFTRARLQIENRWNTREKYTYSITPPATAVRQCFLSRKKRKRKKHFVINHQPSLQGKNNEQYAVKKSSDFEGSENLKKVFSRFKVDSCLMLLLKRELESKQAHKIKTLPLFQTSKIIRSRHPPRTV